MRLHIFGASGSGVTTLGQQLSQRFNLPYYDTDSYHWVPTYPPFTIKRPAEERHLWLVNDLAKQNSWILGGTVYNWGNYYQSAFDVAVYLWVPPAIRLQRLHKREEARGQLTNAAATLAQSKFFLDWTAHYDEGDLPGRSRTKHIEWISKLTCPVIRIEGDTTTVERLQLIEDAISKVQRAA